jgi:hypothetical protein
MPESYGRADVYGNAVRDYLIAECLSLHDSAKRDLERFWMLGAQKAYSLGIRSAPTLIENLIASESCLHRFGVEILSRTPGFYHYTREQDSICDCLEWSTTCVCGARCWRLDLDPRLAGSGLLVPYRGSLMIYRCASDQHPFTLKIRLRRVA